MKKVIKAICCILAAVILVGGGYVAGQRAKQSSIVSALPKNILDMPKESNEPSESAEPVKVNRTFKISFQCYIQG